MKAIFEKKKIGMLKKRGAAPPDRLGIHLG